MATSGAPAPRAVFAVLASLVLVLTAGPIGTAVFVLGFGHGESPCILCWAQRTGMALVALTGIFVLRYGPRPRYVGFALLVAVHGIYMALRHSALHLARDIGQGFSGEILGAHTNTWSLLIFWTAALVMAALLMSLPDGSATRTPRTPTAFERIVIWLFIVAAAGNAVQAFASTGPPPFVGQSDPVRFSFDPRRWVWSYQEYEPAAISLRGRFTIPRPSLEGLPADPAAGPFEGLRPATPLRRLGPVAGVAGPLTGLAFDSASERFLVTTEGGIHLVDGTLSRVLSRVIVDRAFSVDLARFAGGAFLDAGAVLALSENKSYVIVKENPAAEPDANFRFFLEPGPFDEVARGRFATVRARMAFVRSVAFDPAAGAVFTVSLPNPRSPKLVVCRFDRADLTLSQEFLPRPEGMLRPGRTLDELYVTGASWHEGALYAVSAAYSTLVRIDVRAGTLAPVAALQGLRRPAGLAFKDTDVYVAQEDGSVVVYEPWAPGPDAAGPPE